MSNMAVGIPIGMGAGIAVGIASGKSIGDREAREKISEKIRAFAATHRIDIQNSGGFAVSLEEFIKEVVGEPAQVSNKKTTVVLAATIGALVLILGVALFLFFMRR